MSQPESAIQMPAWLPRPKGAYMWRKPVSRLCPVPIWAALVGLFGATRAACSGLHGMSLEHQGLRYESEHSQQGTVREHLTRQQYSHLLTPQPLHFWKLLYSQAPAPYRVPAHSVIPLLPSPGSHSCSFLPESHESPPLGGNQAKGTLECPLILQ